MCSPRFLLSVLLSSTLAHAMEAMGVLCNETSAAITVTPVRDVENNHNLFVYLTGKESKEIGTLLDIKARTQPMIQVQAGEQLVLAGQNPSRKTVAGFRFEIRCADANRVEYEMVFNYSLDHQNGIMANVHLLKPRKDSGGEREGEDSPMQVSQDPERPGEASLRDRPSTPAPAPSSCCIIL